MKTSTFLSSTLVATAAMTAPAFAESISVGSESDFTTAVTQINSSTDNSITVQFSQSFVEEDWKTGKTFSPETAEDITFTADSDVTVTHGQLNFKKANYTVGANVNFVANSIASLGVSVLEGATLTVGGSVSCDAGYIKVYDDSLLNVSESAKIHASEVWVSSARFNVSGGEVSARNGVQVSDSTFVAENAEISITGAYAAFSVDETSSVKISGSTITTNESGYVSNCGLLTLANTTVSAGMIVNAGTITVEGNTTLDGTIYLVNSPATLTVDSTSPGTLTVAADAVLTLSKDSSFVLYGVEDISTALILDEGAKIVMDGCTTDEEAQKAFASLFKDTSGNAVTVSEETLATYSNAVVAVPEPSAFGLLAGLGALALVAARRQRKA